MVLKARLGTTDVANKGEKKKLDCMLVLFGRSIYFLPRLLSELLETALLMPKFPVLADMCNPLSGSSGLVPKFDGLDVRVR